MLESSIRAVTVAELEAFYATKAWGEGVRPINALRARAQAHNPYADPQDVVLLVAFEGGRCVGYLGLLPSMAQVGQQRAKIYWLSAWFVDPSARSSSAGALLLMRAIRLGYDLFACGMSKDSLAALEAMRFPCMPPLRSHRLILDRRIDLVTAPLRAMRRAVRLAGRDPAPLHRLVGRARDRLKPLKEPLWRRLTRGLNNRTSLQFAPVCAVQESSRSESPDYGFCRDASVVNWMLDYPWVPQDGGVDDDYRFSARRDVFRYLAFEARDGDQAPSGYSTMLITREFGVTSLRLLDLAVASPGSDVEAAALLVQTGLVHNVDVIEVPDAVVGAFRAIDGVAGFIETVETPCMYRLSSSSSPLGGAIERMRPRLIDGDLPFA